MKTARPNPAVPSEDTEERNASTDGSAEIVRDEFPDVRLMRLPANVGALRNHRGPQALRSIAQDLALMGFAAIRAFKPGVLARVLRHARERLI